MPAATAVMGRAGRAMFGKLSALKESKLMRGLSDKAYQAKLALGLDEKAYEMSRYSVLHGVEEAKVGDEVYSVTGERTVYTGHGKYVPYDEYHTPKANIATIKNETPPKTTRDVFSDVKQRLVNEGYGKHLDGVEYEHLLNSFGSAQSMGAKKMQEAISAGKVDQIHDVLYKTMRGHIDTAVHGGGTVTQSMERVGQMFTEADGAARGANVPNRINSNIPSKSLWIDGAQPPRVNPRPSPKPATSPSQEQAAKSWWTTHDTMKTLLGVAVAGGLVHSMSRDRGQQTNAQLYGQARPYQ